MLSHRGTRGLMRKYPPALFMRRVPLLLGVVLALAVTILIPTVLAQTQSTDATLSDLTLSDVDFGTFASATTTYTASVAHSVTETTVNPTVNHSGASYVIKLDGVTVADGELSLSVGSNVITVEVTAEDGNTTETYTVTVTRAENTDATGTPTFVGPLQVGGVLRVDTSSVDDVDGLTNPDFSYTWFADDDLIEPGAFLRALGCCDGYEIAPYDVGMTMKLQLHFDDDVGNAEVIRVQAPTPVAAVPPDQPGNLSASLGDPGKLDLSWSSPAVCDFTLVFDCWFDIDRSAWVVDGGSDITGYTVQWKLSSGDWGTAADVTEADVTDTSYTITGLIATNSYTVRVRARNAAGTGSPSTEVTVSGADLNVGPVVTGRAMPSFFETNPRDVTTYTVTDPENDSIIWTLSGDDASFFSIANGVLNFDSGGDFEDPQDTGANNAYDVTILASDGDNTATFRATVVIIDVEDERPVITGDDALTLAENTDTTTVLQTYSATDPEGVYDSFTWSVGGTDSDEFEISESGELTFKETPDFEIPGDSDGDNVYEFQVRAEDGSKTGRLDLTVTVTNVNEPPSTPTGKDAITVAENTSGNLAQYTSTDPDAGDTVTWEISGTDADDFRIDSSGNLAFDGAPDYEISGDSDSNNVYEVSVDAKDAALTSSLSVTVTVTPVDEPPVITGVTTISDYAENGTDNVATYTAEDPEDAPNINWTLGGPDRGDFDITGGVLTFKSPPDHERPVDSGGNNRYEVIIQAADPNNNRGELLVDVIVTPVNEPPVFTGPETVDDFPENSPTSRQVARYTASDPEGANVTLELVGPAGDQFTLASNGVVTFNESPDFEEKQIYVLSILPSDGRSLGPKIIFVNIQNVEEPGVINLSSVQPQEGTSLTATLEDDDGPTSTTWQWYRTPSRSGTGTAITNATSSSYTPDADDVGSYLRAVASYDDGFDTDNTAMAFSAYRVQEPPATPQSPEFATNGDYERSIRENLSAGRNLGAPVRATDPNNEKLTYSIPTSDDFEIIDSTGQLRTNAMLDHEDQDVHTITVTATDPGGLTDTVTVTITVEDVDETPVVLGPASVNIWEYDSGNIETYTSTDPDEEGIDLVLTGADAEEFTLSSDGVLALKEPLDFEEPTDSNRDNRHQLTIEAHEQGDGTSVGRLNVTIHVINVDEPGMIETNADEPRVGQTVRLDVVDADGGERVSEWKWERGIPNSPCDTVDNPTVTTWQTITGVRSSSYTPTIDDQGYCIRATAFYTDGTGAGRTEQFLTPNSVEIGPFFTQDAPTFNVQENTAEGRNVGRVQARHSTSGETLTYTLSGADATYFTIDNEGQLKTSATVMDYEFQPGPEAEFEVMATDQSGQTATITVTIDVTDECTSTGEPPCAPGRPRVSSASDTSLQVSWSVPRTPSGADVTGYDLRYRELDSGDSWTPETVSGTDRSHTIENLDEDTVYEVQVRGRNADGEGAWSDSGRIGSSTGTNPGIILNTLNNGGSSGGGGGGGGGSSNRAPSVEGPKSLQYPEHGTQSVATYEAEDPEGTDISWEIEDTDAEHFRISEEGVLSFINPPDYENPVDFRLNNTYEIRILAFDSGIPSRSGRLQVRIEIKRVNELEPVTGEVQLSVAENQTDVLTQYQARDPEGDAVQWSLSGPDAALFQIDEAGTLSLNTALDYEVPANESATNDYDLSVVATDDNRRPVSQQLEVTVMVTDVNELDPVSGEVELSVEENHSGILTQYQAKDPEGDAVQWSLSGPDAALFQIGEAGNLSLSDALDFEAPASAAGTNEYDLTISASDDGKPSVSRQLQVRIEIGQVNELDPVSGEVQISVEENHPGILTQYHAQDPEGDAIEWSLSGSDAALFQIDEAGTLSLNGALDFEAPASAAGTNEYALTVVATDDGEPPMSQELEVVVVATNVNEDPVGTRISPAELTAGNPITTLDLGEFFADPDGDSLTFTLLDDAESRAASALVEDRSLTITPLEAGTASFAVTAADPSGLSIAITIVVNVIVPPPPEQTPMPTPTPMPVPTPTLGPTPTATPTPVPTPTPTAEATPLATRLATPRPTGEATKVLTRLAPPSMEPTPTFTPDPSPTPEAESILEAGTPATIEQVGIRPWLIALMVTGLLLALVGVAAYAYRRLR